MIGVTNENLLIGSASAIYLHKIWSADPQKFAAIVAHNPRTQRQFLSAIAQMQRLTVPSQYILTKGNVYFNLTIRENIRGRVIFFEKLSIPPLKNAYILYYLYITLLVLEELSVEVETF